MMERKIWCKGDKEEKDLSRDEVLKENRTKLNYADLQYVNIVSTCIRLAAWPGV